MLSLAKSRISRIPYNHQELREFPDLVRDNLKFLVTHIPCNIYIVPKYVMAFIRN